MLRRPQASPRSSSHNLLISAPFRGRHVARRDELGPPGSLRCEYHHQVSYGVGVTKQHPSILSSSPLVMNTSANLPTLFEADAMLAEDLFLDLLIDLERVNPH